jgi:hypothetical protein
MKMKLLILCVLIIGLISCSGIEDIFSRSSATPTTLPETVSPAISTPTPTETPLFPTPTPTQIPIQTESLSFLHLRFEYTTTSDWTRLEFTSTEHILTARQITSIGNPQNPFAGIDGISFGQDINGPTEAETVGLVVDLLLAPEARNQEFAFVLQKGNWNGSYVKISHIVDDVVNEIMTIEHEGVVPSSDGMNTLPISIDFTAQGELALETSQAQRLALPKMIWAVYYTWYSLDTWDSNLLVDRPATPYASHDPEAIAHHIEQAQDAGIDGFIADWWGPGNNIDQNLVTLLDLAQDRGFSISVYFETLYGADSAPQPKSVIIEWLRYLITTYADHPAFYKVNGKPVIVIWASGTVPDSTWQEVFDTLRAEGLEAFTLGMGYTATNLEVFDGIQEYGIFLYEDLLQVFTDAGRMTHYYPLLTEDAQPKVWAATVQPGYDDRLIPEREGLFQDRENGDFYRNTFEAAIASNPDWIFITTWNEWWEHTHIEPSENFGELYLDITRDYARQWKGQ